MQTPRLRRERIIAVVPLRDGHSGKSRLADHLTPEQRSHVVTVLAQHVVETLLGAEVFRRVLVVTADPSYARSALPAHPCIAVVPQPEERTGLNAAVTLGHELAVAQGADRLLVAHADLPLLETADVHALLNPSAPLTLAPDRAGTGTNALVLDATIGAFRFRFGPDSRRAHAQEASDRGLRIAVVERPGLSTDLDTTDDWAALPGTLRSFLERPAPVSLTSGRGGPPPAAAGASPQQPTPASPRRVPDDRR